MSEERYMDSPGTSHKKPSQPSKLVSLGAAADYKGEQQTNTVTDLFGTMSVEPNQPQQQSQFSSGDGGFADFESAFNLADLVNCLNYAKFLFCISPVQCYGTFQYHCILLDKNMMSKL